MDQKQIGIIALKHLTAALTEILHVIDVQANTSPGYCDTAPPSPTPETVAQILATAPPNGQINASPLQQQQQQAPPPLQQQAPPPLQQQAPPPLQQQAPPPLQQQQTPEQERPTPDVPANMKHLANQPVPEADWPKTVDTKVGLDIEGIPWDKRKDSSGKTKYKNPTKGRPAGSWVRRKGIHDDVWGGVRSELILILQAVSPPPTGQPQQDGQQQSAPQDQMSWRAFIDAVTMANLPPESVNQACKVYGVNDQVSLQDYPEKIANVAHYLRLT